MMQNAPLAALPPLGAASYSVLTSVWCKTFIRLFYFVLWSLRCACETFILPPICISHYIPTFGSLLHSLQYRKYAKHANLTHPPWRLNLRVFVWYNLGGLAGREIWLKSSSKRVPTSASIEHQGAMRSDFWDFGAIQKNEVLVIFDVSKNRQKMWRIWKLEARGLSAGVLGGGPAEFAEGL